MRAAAGRKPVEGSNLITFARRERAWLSSIARTSDMGMDAAAPPRQPGQPRPGVGARNQGPLFAFADGVPLEAGGSVVGAMEVSDAP